MKPNRFALEDYELITPSVLKIRTQFLKELEEERLKLESHLNEIETACIRRRIKDLRLYISELTSDRL